MVFPAIVLQMMVHHRPPCHPTLVLGWRDLTINKEVKGLGWVGLGWVVVSGWSGLGQGVGAGALVLGERDPTSRVGSGWVGSGRVGSGPLCVNCGMVICCGGC